MTRALVVVLLLLSVGCRTTIELDPGATAACLTVGSSCALASECCSGICDGSCIAVSGCSPAGEACGDASECCSHACASDGEGRVICHRLGGCRVAGELCASNSDCCVGSSCDAGRCVAAASCVGSGEICRVNGDATATRDCCEVAGVPGQCNESDVHGIDRCGTPACLAEGASCSSPGDCCEGRCVDDEALARVCRASCINGQGRCTTDADCCSGACGSDLHCVSRDTVCLPLASPCENEGENEGESECCSGSCDDGSCGPALL